MTIERIFKINSKIDDITDVNKNIISNSCLPFNIYNTAVFLPIKIGSFYLHFSFYKNNFNKLKNAINYFNNPSEILNLDNNLYDEVYFDLDYNFQIFKKLQNNDLIEYLHPRKRNKILFEDYFKFLKNQKIKLSKLNNFKFLINDDFSEYQKFLPIENTIKENDIYFNGLINTTEYFSWIKNEKNKIQTEEFNSFLNENLIKKRKENLIKIYGQSFIFDRVKYELHLINSKNYSQYFQNVFFIVKYLKDNKYPHFIRGSAAGSVVLYLLGISNLNPIKYNIDFDRFLGGTKTADIDIDIPGEDRDKIIDDLRKIFISKNLDIFKIGIKTTLHSEKFVIHPVGLLIENNQILNQLPLFSLEDGYKASELFDSGATPILDGMGFLKYDLLNSNIILKMKNNLISKNLNINSIIEDWDEIDWNPKFYELLLKGEFFQFTSQGALNLLNKYEPKNYIDLVKLIASNRPAILYMGVDNVVKNLKLGEIEVSKNKEINDIFKDSKSGNILLYQDQIINILKLVLPNLDEKLIIKLAKGRGDLNLYENEFSENFLKLDNNQKLLKSIWQQIIKFEKYGLNKAHSHSYGIITFLELFSSL